MMNPDTENRQAQQAVERACRLIENSETTPTLAELARQAGLSPAHFQRVFVARVGVSPKSYGTTLRRQRLSAALAGASSVTDAIYAAGYTNSSVAYRDGAALGMQPSRLRRGGSGEQIRHAHAPCSLGTLFVAATARGLCAVEFSDPAAGEAGLRRRFPDAQIAAGDRQLDRWLKQLIALVDSGESGAGLPLDIRGTAFQTRVWRALQKIPPGTTVSYGQLARKLGDPQGARAVASACARNSLAVVVPCHRVVGADGALTGYRWGIARKRALLAREASGAEASRRRGTVKPGRREPGPA
jgi:AraC family transcriptional regulator, regulatory protein of adaptative response / methylated-DNA-[protein]-cysteine methyltransferase